VRARTAVPWRTAPPDEAALLDHRAPPAALPAGVLPPE
jgi:hypothetical protein